MSNPNAWEIESPQDLSDRLGLPFSNLSLLIRALTHDSYVNEHSEALEDNERLEFLGDSVLGLVVGTWVYNHFPEMPEGDLTRMRSAFVRNEKLAKFARKLNLGGALRLGRGLSIMGDHDRDRVLGSAFEALVGALYLDTGLEAVVTFVHPILEEARESIFDEIHDWKSILQNWTQSQKLGSPRYRVVNTIGPDHVVVFEIVVEVAGEMKGQGSGTSKKIAERAAAQDALKKLGLIYLGL